MLWSKPSFRFSMSKRRRVALVGIALSFVLAGTLHAATVVGSSSRDVIRGTAKADELYGLTVGSDVSPSSLPSAL